MRNPLTAWTKGHELVSMSAQKVEGMSATPVFNKPQDLVGISIAMDLGGKFKDVRNWFKDKKKTMVNVQTIREFQSTVVDRVTDECLNLPPITDHYVSFDTSINLDSAEQYNLALVRARRLRISLERRGKATQQELQKLMAYLQTLQQFIVSPLLAEKGASCVQADPDLVKMCSLEDTGSMKILKSTIIKLQEEGFTRVMVAVCHTSLMVVAEAYLKRECPGIGDVILYHGGLSLKKRSVATTNFLGNPKTVMLMSVDAGGTGLHLVPGANAVIFWGSRPYSPMQVIQTKKRVHRIGQEFPVKVVHLVAKGSVDYAINLMHQDKLTLAKAILDNEMSDLEAEDGKWRKVGRIVDGCMFLDGKTGNFPENPITEEEILKFYDDITARADPEQVSPLAAQAVPIIAFPVHPKYHPSYATYRNVAPAPTPSPVQQMAEACKQAMEAGRKVDDLLSTQPLQFDCASYENMHNSPLGVPLTWNLESLCPNKKESNANTLNLIYDILKRYPDLYVQCHSSTDTSKDTSTVSEKYDQPWLLQYFGFNDDDHVCGEQRPMLIHKSIANNRVNAVKDALVSRGIPVERVVATKCWRECSVNVCIKPMAGHAFFKAVKAAAAKGHSQAQEFLKRSSPLQ